MSCFSFGTFLYDLGWWLAYLGWVGLANLFIIRLGFVNHAGQRPWPAWLLLNLTQPYQGLAGHLAYHISLFILTSKKRNHIGPQGLTQHLVDSGLFSNLQVQGLTSHGILSNFSWIPGQSNWSSLEKDYAHKGSLLVGADKSYC
jgi:hypothetical protein